MAKLNERQLQEMMQTEFKRLLSWHNNKKQYAVADVASHTHNNFDSKPVNYYDLTNASQIALNSTSTLTPAQVKTLNTSPFQLLIPPQANSFYIVEGVSFRLVYSGTAYTGTHNIEIHYTDGSGPMCTDSVTPAFLNATSSGYYYAPAVASSFAPIAGGSGNNGRIVVFVNTADPAVGNSQLIITTKYRLVTFNI